MGVLGPLLRGSYTLANGVKMLPNPEDWSKFGFLTIRVFCDQSWILFWSIPCTKACLFVSTSGQKTAHTFIFIGPFPLLDQFG